MKVINKYFRNNFITDMLIFLIIFLSSGYYSHAVIPSGTIRMGSMLIVAAITFIYVLVDNQKHYCNKASSCTIKNTLTKIIYKKRLFLTFNFLLFVFSLLSMLYNKQNLFEYAVLWGVIAISSISYLSLDQQRFPIAFERVVFVLSVWSLVSYFVSFYNFDFKFSLPVIINKSNLKAGNLGLSVLPYINRGGFIRNYGLFWEPGAFQTFVNFSLIFELFLNKRARTLYVAVFTLTILTTFSTTGFFGLCMIYIIYLLSLIGKKRNERLSMNIVTLFIVVLIFISYFLFVSTLPKEYSDATVNKIKFQVEKVALLHETETVSSAALLHETETVSSAALLHETETVSSAASTNELHKNKDVHEKKLAYDGSRISAVLFPLRSYLRSPIFGIGADNMNALANNIGYRFNTATVINWYAENGLFYGLLLSIAVFGITLQLDKNFFIRTLLFITICMIISTEPYDKNPLVYIIIFWGFNNMLNNHNKSSFA